MQTPYKTGAGFYPTLGIVAVIVLASLAMLFVLQPGLPVEPDINVRMSYMYHHRIIWFAAWFLWMMSAFGLLLFCFYFLQFIPGSAATYYALGIVAIGIVPDITAEFIFATVLPWIGANAVGATNITRQIHTEQFRMLEYLAVILTGGFGNGAYNAGGLMLNLRAFKNPGLPRWLLWLGIPSWLLGLALSAATILHEPSWMRIFTAVSMSLSVTWMLLVAMIVYRHPQRYRLRTADKNK